MNGRPPSRRALMAPAARPATGRSAAVHERRRGQRTFARRPPDEGHRQDRPSAAPLHLRHDTCNAGKLRQSTRDPQHAGRETAAVALRRSAFGATHSSVRVALSALSRDDRQTGHRPALENIGSRRDAPRFRRNAVLPADGRRRPASGGRAGPRMWRMAGPGPPPAKDLLCCRRGVPNRVWSSVVRWFCSVGTGEPPSRSIEIAFADARLDRTRDAGARQVRPKPGDRMSSVCGRGSPDRLRWRTTESSRRFHPLDIAIAGASLRGEIMYDKPGAQRRLWCLSLRRWIT